MHLNGRDIIFERQNKLYVAKAQDLLAHVLVTVEEKKAQFSSEQVKKAEAAYNLMKNSGYPSPNELMRLVSDGNVMNMPVLWREDILRAYEIFGPPAEYVRGKLTKTKVNRVPVDLLLKADDKNQVLWSDVMHIDGNKIFISVANPLQLLTVSHLKDETANSLGEALQGQLEILRERDFTPVVVSVDPASALMSLRGQFPGVVVDPTGAGDHVPKVDIRILRVKEMYRAVKSGLPWCLPNPRVKDLVIYCVSRMNLCTTSALQDNVCPRVLFTGVKPNYRKELELAFGDYVELYTGTDNTSKERSTPCIALYPVGNSTGAWQFWNLHLGKYMRHSTWVRMNTNELIIDMVNAEADRAADSTERAGAEISMDSSMASEVEAVTTDNNVEVEEGIDRNAEPDLEAAPDLMEAEGAAGTDSVIEGEVQSSWHGFSNRR